MTDITALMQAIAQFGLPVALVAVFVWWVIKEAWPYWKDRDTTERGRHYERDMADVEARKATAEAAVRFADAIEAFTAVLEDKCN